MYSKENIFTPKQPFFVMSTAHYYKYVVMKYGISHFYSFIPSNNINNIVTIVPDGCIDIIFQCSNNCKASIYGTVLKCGTSEFIKGEYYFGIRFLPGQAVLPEKLSIGELIESEVSLRDVLNNKELIEKILSSRDFKYQINIFMKEYLKSYIDRCQLRDLKKYLIDEILSSKGNIKIETLSEECGYSTRYINKIFTDEYGLSPKAFCRMMRFQNFLCNLNEKDQYSDITDIALDAGYFDQSHLYKDFRGFTNLTPKRYLKEVQKSSYNKRIIIV